VFLYIEKLLASSARSLELVAGFPPTGDKLRLRTSLKKDVLPDVFFGACGRIRTGDLLITSELLCQLSHTSTVKYQMIV
jgi:hypothetical protein